MKLINSILFALSILFLATSIVYNVNYLDYAAPIEYKNYNDISLKDFKGIKRIGESLDGNSEFAYIVTDIRITKNDYPYGIKTFFYPSRSYVFDKNTIGNDDLLRHELYHFHITEYIARKMRKYIAETKNEDLNIETLLASYKKEETQLQRQYDNDTYHSYYHGEQLKWQKKIDSLLITLNNYQYENLK